LNSFRLQKHKPFDSLHSMMPGWKVTGRFLLELLLFMVIVLHSGMPVEAHDAGQSVCCHSKQNSCSILEAASDSVSGLQHRAYCEFEYFSIDQLVFLSLDPPPKR